MRSKMTPQQWRQVIDINLTVVTRLRPDGGRAYNPAA